MPTTSEARAGQIIALRRAGRSYLQICKELNTCANTIVKVLPEELKRGLGRMGRTFTPDEMQQIRSLRSEGMGKERIARILHTSKEKIHGALCDLGMAEKLTPIYHGPVQPEPPMPKPPTRPVTNTTTFRPSRGDFGATAIRWWDRCDHGTRELCTRCA